MDKIAQRLKAYIETHPIDLGDSDCKTVLDQLYQPTQNPTNPTRRKSVKASKNWKNSSASCRWKITMPSSTSAVAYAAPTSARHLSMDCYTAHT